MHSELTQVAEIAWSAQQQLTRAEGACEAVFGRPASALLGSPLHEVLGIPPERAAELDAHARSTGPTAPEFLNSAVRQEPCCLRLVLGMRDGEATAGVLNLSTALIGAPPLQVSKLSSSLSHEIRNPLSSVKMAVQTLARNSGLSERDQRRLAIANREIRTMERMLWLFSEYGRDTAPMLEQLTLRALIQEAAAMIEPELADRKVQLAFQEDEGLPKIRCDAGRLRPVLSQILLNVASGQPAGSTVTLVLRRDTRACLLVLEDTSAALPPEERDTLFEPFGSRLARGAGLSLAALHRVMQNLGGSVTASGGASPGITLTLSFPA
jgi:two-component system, NtrC family, sensor histidine kinase HydH